MMRCILKFVRWKSDSLKMNERHLNYADFPQNSALKFAEVGLFEKFHSPDG